MEWMQFIRDMVSFLKTQNLLVVAAKRELSLSVPILKQWMLWAIRFQLVST